MHQDWPAPDVTDTFYIRSFSLKASFSWELVASWEEKGIFFEEVEVWTGQVAKKRL